ncbi:MAG: DUF1127 domain-containing protein [Pseudomonadota bacterium]
MTSRQIAQSPCCADHHRRARLTWPLWQYIAAWHKAARARRALRQLNDHMLRDIGLTRAEVASLHDQIASDPDRTPPPFGRP